METEHDSRLTNRARTGDKEAWATLYRAAYPDLLAYCTRRTGNLDEAKEIVSETFMQAVNSFESFKGVDDGFRPWVFGIAKNVLARHFRQSMRFSHMRNEDEEIDWREPIDGILESDTNASLLVAFDRLTKTEKEIMEFRFVGQLSSEQIARILETTPSAIRMAQKRALEKLRTWMREAEHVS